MPEYIGNIEVPALTASEVWPLLPDYPHGRAIQPEVVTHRFGSGDTKIEQRFLLGDGATRFQVVKHRLNDTDRAALVDFWDTIGGPAGIFFYDAPDDQAGTTTRYTVRFENAPLEVQMLGAAVASCGVTLVEVGTDTPTYTLNSTVTRFPSAGLQTALLAQVQRVIPLLKIRSLDGIGAAAWDIGTAYSTGDLVNYSGAAYVALRSTTGDQPDISPSDWRVYDIYLSDRRCQVGTQVYLPRLLRWEGISQGMGGEPDEAQFVFGNADRVMRDLANDTDLVRASVEFSLFHVGSGIKLDLWKGNVTNWNLDEGPEFTLSASDAFYELTLPYPTRKISRMCHKVFDDGVACPYTTQGSGGDPLVCDKTLSGAKGCNSHAMNRYFGGIIASPQSVRIKDNGTGVWGFRRSSITSTSLVGDSIYDQVLPEIYTDGAMPVNCKITAGREESDFYDALGIVGEGPLGAMSAGATIDGRYEGPTLDGQPHHGYGTSNPSYGLRQALGTDPVAVGEEFVLATGQPGETLDSTYAAGVAWQEVRRVDPKGFEPSALAEHSMQAVVTSGVKGWIWTATNTRTLETLTNPIWICVNMILRALGLRNATATVAEGYFDLDAAIAAATICNNSVTPVWTRYVRVWTPETGHYEGDTWVIDTPAAWTDEEVTSETQFKFRGVFQEEKPLRDWLAEVLANCLGYYTFAFGKFKPGIRINSSVIEAFTAGNILFESLQLAPARAAFNSLTGTFADEEYEFKGNTLGLYDADHAAFLGGGAGPVTLKSQINLCGVSNKSQAARIVTTRLREEMGGISASEWKAARQVGFKTTVLALNVEPGMVCSMTHADMPGGAGEFRVQSWRLNPDYSIEIQGRTTTDNMYDLAVGPKPADVLPDPLPVQYPQYPIGLVWHPHSEQPAASDPLFATDDWSFYLAQEYVEKADESMQANVVVSGAMPVSVFLPSVAAPTIRHFAIATTGGLLAGAKQYYFSVAAIDAAGKLTPPSNVISASVPTSAEAKNLITLSGITWPAGTYTGYIVFAAADDQQMLSWQSNTTAALPEIIRCPGPISRSVYSMPSPYLRRLRIRAKRVYHSGPVGATITSVAANSIVCSALAGLGDDWTGRVVSVIADASDGSAPIWNFTVSAYTDGTGTFTVTPDPVAAGVAAGDVLVIRTAPTAVTDTSVTDAKWQNGVYPSGMTADEEIGRLIRVIAGTGRGQVRRIVDNDATSLTIDTAWETNPDATSVFIVEAPIWEYISESEECSASTLGVATSMRMPVDNLLEQVILVQGLTLDINGKESPDNLSPVREIYLFGSDAASSAVTINGDPVTY